MAEEQASPGNELVTGLYERLLDGDLRQLIDANASVESILDNIDAADVPHVVAQYVARRVEAALSRMEQTEKQVHLVNKVLALLDHDEDRRNLLAPGPRILREVLPLTSERVPAPSTPLSEVALLTNAVADPQLFSELRLEMHSADSVDLLCAFVKNSGMRLLTDSFDALRRRGVPLRVLTTTYIGATDRKALDDLVRNHGAQVKISYQARSTRLHAKAWLFRRRSGFHTAYVGSSNLSRDALVDGLEWNVRLSQMSTPSILDKFTTTFDVYWNSPEFETYDPDRDAERLDAALAANGKQLGSGTVDLSNYLDVRPYPHQEEILSDLQGEREIHGYHRNLVVAATGTGKTVVAALDYQGLCRKAGRPLRLLFLAHRKEILEQSRGAYRAVMKDGAFGELFVDGEKPRRREHVFASVQAMARSAELERWARDAFDVIVVDEFHHADAPSYRRIMDYFVPVELLGLTATPERADGVNVADEFFHGRIASSLRLWDALDADLLVPFHYFGISDDVDLRDVAMIGGEYDRRVLDSIYTGNHVRAAKILEATRQKVTDLGLMKALGFCVSVAHAQFMAEAFTRSGIQAVALSGQSRSDQRRETVNALKDGRIQCIFTVDLFNEGLDIPAVDTVLLLRPTQSATIFLQQLGRGLRRAEGKAVLTVLDFVGMQNRAFRFDLKLRALTGLSRRRLERDVEKGFPFLPTGSQIVLDEVVQREVIRNLREQLNLSTKELVNDVHQHLPELVGPQDFGLKVYLDEADRTLADIYGRAAERSYRGEKLPSAWTAIRLKAFPSLPSEGLAEEAEMLRRVRNLTYVDDMARIDAIRRLLSRADHGDEAVADPHARMLFFTFWPGRKAKDLAAGINRLASSTFVRQEILGLLEVCERDLKTPTRPLSGRLTATGLRVHARYSRDEVLGAVGVGTSESGTPASTVVGAKYVPGLQTDVLFVTLQKSAADYSPTTLYQDYAINRTHFHWESQSTTTPESEAGQRYQHHDDRGASVLLFVRSTKESDIGTEPYTCLGTVHYVNHQGSKPMKIIWTLDEPMPAEMLIAARAVA